MDIFKDKQNTNTTNMDNSAKDNQAKDNPAKQAPKFEEAMQQVKDIVNEIEKGELSLEDSIKKYEYALKLIKDCQETLQVAQQKIQNINRAASSPPAKKDGDG